MAVFQAARVRNIARPGLTVRRASRAPARPIGRSATQVRPVALLMAGILAATMLGLVYLTQTLGANAMSSELWEVGGKITALQRQQRNLAMMVETRSGAQEIGRRAGKLGLVQLDDDVVVLRAP